VRDNGVGYSWACFKTVWWEKAGAPQGMISGAGRTKSGGGKGLVLELGMAVLRCAHLRSVVSLIIRCWSLMRRTYGRRTRRRTTASRI
jgi:hypothetical protein